MRQNTSIIQHHGCLLGCKHLCIVDSSKNIKCMSFLCHARDILGENVLFSDADLNQLASLMIDIGNHVSGSSDFIIKINTDEFITFYDLQNKHLTTSISSYLEQFTINEIRDLHRSGDTKVSFIQVSFPSKGFVIRTHIPAWKYFR